MAVLFDGAVFEGSRRPIAFPSARAAGTRFFITTFAAPANTVRLLMLVDFVRAANLSEPTRLYPLQVVEVRRQNESFALAFSTNAGDGLIITPLYDWPRVKVNDNT